MATIETVHRIGIEKFSDMELETLRTQLLRNGLDSWQAAEVLTSFLSGRGYGVSAISARDAVTRIERAGCDYDCMQAEIENLAKVM